MPERKPYDVYREMADSQTFRGGIIICSVIMLVAAVIIGVIAVLMANANLYVHQDVPHPVTLPVHWQ